MRATIKRPEREGDDMDSLEERQRKHVFFTWSAQQKAVPVSIVGGQGAVFTDEEGGRWLDFESQVFNCNLGHGEDRVVAAIQAQAAQLGVAHPQLSIQQRSL